LKDTDLFRVRGVPGVRYASVPRPTAGVGPRAGVERSQGHDRRDFARVDTRVLQVIYRFQLDGLPHPRRPKMDVFIEVPPISDITRKKLQLGVPNPMASSSYN
jgi:hypothetical protein